MLSCPLHVARSCSRREGNGSSFPTFGHGLNERMMIKALIAVPGAESVLPKGYCCYLSWWGRWSLLPISPESLWPEDIYREAVWYL